MPTRKFGTDVADLSCTRVQVGQVERADGSVEPIYDVRPQAPDDYRRLVDIVTNSSHFGHES